MTALERRYRRLLALYPRSYRSRREEEMVAVLLDAAGPGRRWPRPDEALDLLVGSIRARCSAPSPAHAAWRDAAAIATVALVAVLLLSAVRTGAGAARIATAGLPGGGAGRVIDGVSAVHETWAVDLVWVAVAVAVAARLSRTAAALAASATALHLVVLTGLIGRVDDALVVSSSRAFVVGGVVTVLLVADPSRASRGIDLVRRPRSLGRGVVSRTAVLGAAGLAFAVGCAVASGTVSAAELDGSGWTLLDVAPVLVLPVAVGSGLAGVVRWLEPRSDHRSGAAPVSAPPWG